MSLTVKADTHVAPSQASEPDEIEKTSWFYVTIHPLHLLLQPSADVVSESDFKSLFIILHSGKLFLANCGGSFAYNQGAWAISALSS